LKIKINALNIERVAPSPSSSPLWGEGCVREKIKTPKKRRDKGERINQPSHIESISKESAR